MADTSVARERFDNGYRAGTTPWVINEPQPRVLQWERDGLLRGRVLDAGCGAGEHTIHLARLGYDVLGIDFSVPALELARSNAAARGVPAEFAVADALQLSDTLPAGSPPYDTVLDSALFHVFGPQDRPVYARSLHAVTKPGGVLLLLALSDTEPGIGPRIPDTAIRDAFTDGWQVEELTPARYRGYANEQAAPGLGVAVGALVDAAAWQARIRRV